MRQLYSDFGLLPVSSPLDLDLDLIWTISLYEKDGMNKKVSHKNSFLEIYNPEPHDSNMVRTNMTIPQK